MAAALPPLEATLVVDLVSPAPVPVAPDLADCQRSLVALCDEMWLRRLEEHEITAVVYLCERWSCGSFAGVFDTILAGFRAAARHDVDNRSVLDVILLRQMRDEAQKFLESHCWGTPSDPCLRALQMFHAMLFAPQPPHPAAVASPCDPIADAGPVCGAEEETSSKRRRLSRKTRPVLGSRSLVPPEPSAFYPALRDRESWAYAYARITLSEWDVVQNGAKPKAVSLRSSWGEFAESCKKSFQDRFRRHSSSDGTEESSPSPPADSSKSEPDVGNVEDSSDSAHAAPPHFAPPFGDTVMRASRDCRRQFASHGRVCQSGQRCCELYARIAFLARDGHLPIFRVASWGLRVNRNKLAGIVDLLRREGSLPQECPSTWRIGRITSWKRKSTAHGAHAPSPEFRIPSPES